MSIRFVLNEDKTRVECIDLTDVPMWQCIVAGLLIGLIIDGFFSLVILVAMR